MLPAVPEPPRSMKFGMFVLPSWPQRDPSHQGRLYHEMIEQIQYAEELGFESVWLAEHHFTRFGIVPSALPLATYVAGQTKNIRIGTGVSVLNFHDPVFMAEETAMMDLLSDGRMDFVILSFDGSTHHKGRRRHGALVIQVKKLSL